MKQKLKTKGLAALILCLLIAGLSACAGPSSPNETGAALPMQETTALAEEIATIDTASDTAIKLGAEDTDTTWDADSATTIRLTDQAIEIDGSGATADGSVLTISSPGTYVLTGTLTDGQVIVDATKDDLVRIVFGGVSITNQSGAPLYAAQCDKLILTLADDTQNTLTDGGANYAYNNAADEEPNAALFSKDDLTINGGGSLVVNAGFNNGIGTKDDLVIVGGNITVTAANHGIKGNDSVTILNGNIAIRAQSDAIQTDNAEDTAKGWIVIEGGEFSLESENDGIQADTALTITGGTFTITTGASARGSSAASGSYKGMKSSGSISISGGTFSVDSYDDGIHANGSIVISGGELTLTSGDDAVHADESLSVSGGTIAVLSSYEGLEAANIAIAGGTIDIVATDDGINAAGGDDGGMGGRFGNDSFGGGGDYSINVTGGVITLYAGGDGFDSNGDINISGGTILSLIRSSMDNGALDCDGALTITGGTIFYGGTGIGSAPGSGSTQSYVVFSGSMPAGTELTVVQNGEEIARATIGIDCQTIALSTTSIISGQSYELYSGSNLIATAVAGTGGEMNGMGGRGGGMNGNMRGGNGW